MTRTLPTLVLLLAALVPAQATSRRHASAPAIETPQPPAPDDLYRRRGYGTGGLLFGHTAQAGACADLAFARPKACGPKGGYGLYGNGLGYRF